jgi:hypothetical protein
MAKQKEVGRATISGIVSGIMYASFCAAIIFLMLGGLLNIISTGSGDYLLRAALYSGIIFAYTGVMNVAKSILNHYHLVHLDVSQVIGRSYKMLFKNRTLAIVVLVAAIVGLILGALAFTDIHLHLSSVGTSITSSQISVNIDVGALAIILAFVLFFIGVFFTGMIIFAASDGEKAKLSTTIKKAASKYAFLLGTSIAVNILAGWPSALVLILAIYIGAIHFGLTASVLTSIGIILLQILAIYIGLRLIVANVETVVGGKRVTESIKKSWKLTKGNLWGIFAVIYIIAMIGSVVGIIFSLIPLIIGWTVGSTFSIMILGVYFFVALLLSYSTVVATVLIHQLLLVPRQRRAKAQKK